MKLSTRGRYGVKILLDLSINQGKGPVPVGEISLRQDISVKYIDQLMQPLKRAKLIRSVRGPKGGYLLAKSADEITLGTVIQAMEGDFTPLPCVEDAKTCEISMDCRIRAVWQRAIQAMLDELNTTNLSHFYAQTMEGAAPSYKPPCGIAFNQTNQNHKES